MDKFEQLKKEFKKLPKSRQTGIVAGLLASLESSKNKK